MHRGLSETDRVFAEELREAFTTVVPAAVRAKVRDGVELAKDDFVAAHLRGKAYVVDTKYEKAFETDVSKTVLQAFRKHQILPPAVLHRPVDPTMTRPVPRREVGTN